jgi:lipopolysaccharide biosynthesis regulator YciM
MENYLIIALIIVLGSLAWIIIKKYTSKKIELSAQDNEIKGLNLILSGQKEEALGLFKEIALKNTSNTNAFLQVGDLYRELGDPKKAIKVHLEIVERLGLSDAYKKVVLQSLASDYEASKNYKNAIKYASKILEIDKKNRWALKAIHRLNRKLGDWEHAIEAFYRYKKINSNLNPELPSIYKTMEALERVKVGKIEAAKSLLKKAIKLGRCSAPYYYLGFIAKSEGNAKHAIDYFANFAELDVNRASLIFEEIEKLYFEIGKYEQVEQFYARLQKKQPNNVDVLLGLANYLERKGEHLEAHSLLEVAPTTMKHELTFMITEMNLLKKMGQESELKNKIQSFLISETEKKLLTCSKCGHHEKEPIYICSECGYLKEILI